MAKKKTESPSMKKTPATSKEKSKKSQKPKTAPHPPYFQMIKEALIALKEKNGSSPYAIAKQIEEKHKSVLPENFRKTLSLQLKNSVAKGKLVKIRASYKVSENTTTRTTRQQIKKKKKEEKETKTTRASSRRSKKTMPVNKPEMATKKKRKAKKPRQPKSIKSSAAKKALKASAN